MTNDDAPPAASSRRDDDDVVGGDGLLDLLLCCVCVGYVESESGFAVHPTYVRTSILVRTYER